MKRAKKHFSSFLLAVVVSVLVFGDAVTQDTKKPKNTLLQKKALISVPSSKSQSKALFSDGTTASAEVNINIVKIDMIRFQNSNMAPVWKNVDQSYKHPGVFTGQTVSFGVVTIPSNMTLPDGFLAWGGLASGGSPEVSITFDTPNFLQAVTSTCGGVPEPVLVAVRDQPSGPGEIEYAAQHPVWTAIALMQNLIGQDVTTLEPFIWASSSYPGIQHNTIADAARHAYWTCLLTRYTAGEYALGLTTAHEVSGPGPSTETIMDLHNNLAGISVEGNHIHSSSLDCCRVAVQSAISAGISWYLDSSYGAVNTNEDALLQPTNK